MKDRIAHFVFSPYVGGAEAVMLHILKNMDRFSSRCVVITSSEIAGDFAKVGFPVEVLGSFNFFSKTLEPFPAFPAVNRLIMKAYLHVLSRRLAKLIKRHHIKVLHSHLVFDHFMVGCLRSRDLNWIATMHGSYRLDMAERFLFSRRDVARMFGKPAMITSACQYFFNLLEREGVQLAGRRLLVPNGVSQRLFSLRDEPRPAGDVLNMVFLGGDRYEKGGDILMRALDIVVNRQGRGNLMLNVLRRVRPDSEISRLVKKFGLEDHVKFRGYVKGGVHIDHMNRSDILVLPSRTEGIANTIMEAVGIGMPILATDVGGTSEVVNHGSNGMLSEPTPESLAEGIEFFLDNPGAIREFGENNLRLREEYAWKQIVPRYEDLYALYMDEDQRSDNRGNISSSDGGHEAGGTKVG